MKHVLVFLVFLLMLGIGARCLLECAQTIQQRRAVDRAVLLAAEDTSVH